MNTVLLVDDDVSLNDLLTTYLSTQGFSVHQAFNGQEALNTLKQESIDIAVLDIMMPVMDGLDTLKAIRHTSQLPVLMLTAKTEDIDRIIGLEMGADDYLAKPCNPRELVARIKAILRRTQLTSETPITPQPSSIMRFGELEINPSRYEAFVGENKLPLTGAEFKLLQVFTDTPGEVLSKEALTQSVLNRPLEAYDRAIDVHVSNLRKKLVHASLPNDLITNVRGRGYLLKHELFSE